MLLSDVCLSVTYIGPNLRTERPRKTKIGTDVAHVTRDSDVTIKVKRSTWRINTKILLCRNSTATWRINSKILSTCRGGGILCRPHAQLVYDCFALVCVLSFGCSG